ncbi:TraR/DksA family transcriptional regulator [Halobacteriovorax sp. GB3]|uniref:TraR/DksA family transcriptional regulator n=1 Tax=Halobacteriovorax sp. GB3 TaxID=2719615 RepID=UPI002361BF3A|nr:TraR/DksA family transcriptional regulator [Halobacteriovorax sp. GB3]MDD0853310.1 TraR/DksA family transcriptional regulator [Halobacteriovorax sp. GB3]
MTRENEYLSDEQIKSLKDKLLGDKERILNNISEKDTYHLDKNELSDPVDEASINVQTAHEIRFKNRENFYLKKINKTLTKVENGTYGLCEDCDAEIAYERLIARPTAELCISCKEESELNEKSNFFLKRSKSLGKTLSEIGKR